MFEWSPEFPGKPGRYWFYGEPHMGAMGVHYRDPTSARIDLHVVDIWQAQNSLVCVCNGSFIAKTKWDGKKEGWLGVWLPLPDPVTPTKESILATRQV